MLNPYVDMYYLLLENHVKPRNQIQDESLISAVLFLKLQKQTSYEYFKRNSHEKCSITSMTCECAALPRTIKLASYIWGCLSREKYLRNVSSGPRTV